MSDEEKVQTMQESVFIHLRDVEEQNRLILVIFELVVG